MEFKRTRWKFFPALSTIATLVRAPLGREVIAVSNTFEEAIESSHVVKWNEAPDKDMASFEMHEAFHVSGFGLNSLGESHRDQLDVQGQSRPHTERTSRDSGMGTSAGSRLWLHLRSGMPYPDNSNGTRHCCARRLGSTSTPDIHS